MLQWEHSAILSTFVSDIKLPFVIKIFVLSIFESLLKTGFTVHTICFEQTGERNNKTNQNRKRLINSIFKMRETLMPIAYDEGFCSLVRVFIAHIQYAWVKIQNFKNLEL